KERRRPTDLARLPNPAGRLSLVFALAASGNAFDVRGLVLGWEEAGHDTVHADPVWGPLDGERLGQVLHARLRCAGVREAGPARPRIRPADVHDRTRRLSCHVTPAE